MVYLPTFTIFYHSKQTNVGKYTIHGCYGYCNNMTLALELTILGGGFNYFFAVHPYLGK